MLNSGSIRTVSAPGFTDVPIPVLPDVSALLPSVYKPISAMPRPLPPPRPDRVE